MKPLALVVFLAAGACAQAWDARLTMVSGSVTVYPRGSDPEGLPAKKDFPLADDDRIATGADSAAELSLDGKSLLGLRPNSDFTIGSLRMADSTFSLAQGCVLAKISGLAGGGLSVKTPSAVAAVRGTEFGVEVSADASEETRVAVFDEGKVEVRGEGGGGRTLQSNQETKAVKGQTPASPSILATLSKYRDQVRAMRGRLKALRKAWKPLSAEERSAKRAKLLAAMREAKSKAKEKKVKKEKTREKESAASRANREKMEKEREAIKRKLGR